MHTESYLTDLSDAEWRLVPRGLPHGGVR